MLLFYFNVIFFMNEIKTSQYLHPNIKVLQISLYLPIMYTYIMKTHDCCMPTYLHRNKTCKIRYKLWLSKDNKITQ